MEAKANNKRPLVFLGVGVFNTLVDFAFYTFLTAAVLEDNIALAGLISGTFALLIAFATHGLITWRGAHLSRKTLLKFFAFTGFGMWVIRPLLLAWFITFTGLYDWVTDLVDAKMKYDFIANTGAFALMLVIVLTYNFVVYDRFVFNTKKSNASGRTEPESRSKS